MEEENKDLVMHLEEETTEPDPVVPPEEEPDWVISEGTTPITNQTGGTLGQLKISSVSIDPKQGLVVEAVDVEVFGDTGNSVVKIDCIDLTYETLQKILSLTEGPEI